jgi:hypothetical protein
MYAPGTVLTAPAELTHLHPDCACILAEWNEIYGGTFLVESASLPGQEHTVYTDEYGNPILCDCFAWTKKDPPPHFVLCWHVNRVQYHVDQCHKGKREKEVSPLNGEAGFKFMR